MRAFPDPWYRRDSSELEPFRSRRWNEWSVRAWASVVDEGDEDVNLSGGDGVGDQLGGEETASAAIRTHERPTHHATLVQHSTSTLLAINWFWVLLLYFISQPTGLRIRAFYTVCKMSLYLFVFLAGGAARNSLFSLSQLMNSLFSYSINHGNAITTEQHRYLYIWGDQHMINSLYQWASFRILNKKNTDMHIYLKHVNCESYCPVSCIIYNIRQNKILLWISTQIMLIVHHIVLSVASFIQIRSYKTFRAPAWDQSGWLWIYLERKCIKV